MNRLQIIGRLGKDPVTKTIASGVACAELYVATSEPAYTTADGRNVPERTTWHNVNVWGRMAKPVTEFLKKGDKLYVEGTLHSRTVETEGRKITYWSVDATSVEFLSMARRNTDDTQSNTGAAQQPTQQPTGYAPYSPQSELPFPMPPDFSH